MYAIQLVSSFDSVTLFVENKGKVEELFKQANFGSSQGSDGTLLTLNEVVDTDICPGTYDTLRMLNSKVVNYLDTKRFLIEQDLPWKMTVGRKILATSQGFPADLDVVRAY